MTVVADLVTEGPRTFRQGQVVKCDGRRGHFRISEIEKPKKPEKSEKGKCDGWYAIIYPIDPISLDRVGGDLRERIGALSYPVRNVGRFV